MPGNPGHTGYGRVKRYGNGLWLRHRGNSKSFSELSWEERIKPKALKPGERIGVIAPAGPIIDWESLERGIRRLEEMGFSVSIGRNLKPGNRLRYLSASDRERLEDLVSMFTDPDIAGIISARGGYGTSRLLNLIPYERIRENPKVFVGYSDITALHLALQARTGLITFHGPMISTDLGRGGDEVLKFNLGHLVEMITGKAVSGLRCDEHGHPHIYGRDISYTDPGAITGRVGMEIKVINPGEADGLLRGGNLTMISSMIGTPYLPSLKGCILLIEDVGEPPYRIDRMLCQLYLSGVFDEVKGLIFDRFIPGVPIHGGKTESYTTSTENRAYEEIAAEFAGRMGVPAIYGLPVGHCDIKLTLPLNSHIRIKTDPITVENLESSFDI